MDALLMGFETRLAASLHPLEATGTQKHRPGGWSIQQIVEHLILTYRSTQTLLEGRIAKRRPTEAKPSLLQHCTQFYVVRLGRFPSGVPAPEIVIPPPTSIAASGDQLLAAAGEQLHQMDAIIEETARLFGPRRRAASHRVLGPLSPGQWRRFHVVHGLHHLRQIDALTRGQRASIPNLAEDPLHR